MIVLSAVDMGKLGLSGIGSMEKIIALVALLGWTTTARLARARALTLREMDFVRAARALGVSGACSVLRHVLPKVRDTVAVATALSASHVLLAESALSFLGLGIAPPMASWGAMLSDAQENIWDHARLAVFPGLLIFMTVLAFNAAAESRRGRI